MRLRHFERVERGKHPWKLTMVGVCGTTLGFWLGGSFKNFNTLVLSMVGAIIILVFANGFLEETIERIAEYSGETRAEVREKYYGDSQTRIMAYIIGLSLLFTTCFILVFIASASIPSDVALLFQILVTPAMVGIRMAIGQKARHV